MKSMISVARPEVLGEARKVSTLKNKVNEFAEIAKSLPENLQVTCFELLLRNHLEVLSPDGAGEKKQAGRHRGADKGAGR